MKFATGIDVAKKCNKRKRLIQSGASSCRAPPYYLSVGRTRKLSLAALTGGKLSFPGEWG